MSDPVKTTSRIIAIFCEKGGVGKTALAALVCTRLRALRRKVTIADVDLVNSGVIEQLFPDALRVNPLYRVELTRLLNRAIAGETLVLDGGSNVGYRLVEYFQAEEPKMLTDLEAAGVKITVIVPLSIDPKSQKSPSIYRRMFPKADFIMAYPRFLGADYGAGKVTAPEGFENAPSMDIIRAPAALVDSYLKDGRTYEFIAGATDPKYAELRPFALEYLEQMNAEIERIMPYLQP